MIAKGDAPAADAMPIEAAFDKLLEAGVPRMEAMKTVARERGLSKREVYQKLNEAVTGSRARDGARARGNSRPADIVTRRVLSDGARLAQAEAFFDQLANHLQKLGMHADRGGAHHVHAALAGDGLRFGIEIVDHFHVIGDETDGHHNYVGAAIHLAQ